MKLLDARQLGLKYIANVTYGYTSASFSGRMPCVEIADSIVEAGRQTLEKVCEWRHHRSYTLPASEIRRQSTWSTMIRHGVVKWCMETPTPCLYLFQGEPRTKLFA